MAPLFYLAPLRGVTDVVFRTAFERRFGRFDFMLAPFVTTVKGRGVARSHLRDLIGEENDRTRVVPQILGNDPDDFLLIARDLYALGYRTINLNLGCPHPQVTKKRRGSGMLPFGDVLFSFLAKVFAGLPDSCSLSVKVRLGLEDSDELARLMPLFNDFPLSEVIIHPRTGKQMYEGTIDTERFAACAAACRHKVVYNGDILTPEDLHKYEKLFPSINRWMVGRGMAYTPTLLSSLRSGCVSEVDFTLFREFHDELFERNRTLLFGPSHLLGKMKEFWRYFACNFPSGHDLLKSIQRCSTTENYLRHVKRAFSSAGLSI